MEEDPVAQATFAQRLKQLMELRDAKQADVIRMAQKPGEPVRERQDDSAPRRYGRARRRV